MGADDRLFHSGRAPPDGLCRWKLKARTGDLRALRVRGWRDLGQHLYRLRLSSGCKTDNRRLNVSPRWAGRAYDLSKCTGLPKVHGQKEPSGVGREEDAG